MADILTYLLDRFRSYSENEKDITVKENINKVISHLIGECEKYETGTLDYQAIQTLRIVANTAIDIKNKNVDPSTFYVIYANIRIEDLDKKHFDTLLGDSIKTIWNQVAKSLKIDTSFNPYPVKYVRAISLKNWVEYGLLKAKPTSYTTIEDEVEKELMVSNTKLARYYINTKKKVSFPLGAILQGGKPCAWVFPSDDILAIYPNLINATVENLKGEANELVDRLGFPMDLSDLWYNNYFISLFYPEQLPEIAYKSSTVHAAWGSPNMYASINDNNDGWGKTIPVYEKLENGFRERVHLAYMPHGSSHEYFVYLLGSINKDFEYDQRKLLEITINNFYRF